VIFARIVPLLIVVGIPALASSRSANALTKSCAIGAGNTIAGTSRSNGIGICLGGRRRIGLLLRRLDDAIVRRAGGGHQRRKLEEGFDSNEDRTNRECGTRHAIGHPDRNRRRALLGLAQPDLAAMPHAALHANRLAVQRMPGIVNGDVLSVVGGM